MTATAAASSAQGAHGVRSRSTFLVLMCCVQLLLASSMTVVTVSLPNIQQDLGMAPANIQWAITAYGLTFGGLLLVGGRAADYFGRRLVLALGLAIFAAGGLACLFATSGLVLMSGRAGQGFGAALASPAAMSLLTATFTSPEERSRALGAWAAIGASGAVLGNVGGGILSAIANWRFSFAPIVGIAIVILAALRFVAPPGERNRTRRLGVVAGSLVTAGQAGVILGMSQAGAHGFASPRSWAPLAAAAGAFLLFVVAQRVSGTVLIPFSLFRSRSAFGFGFVCISFGTTMTVYYFSSFFLQDVRGFSGIQAGLAFGVWAGMIVTSAHVASRLVEPVGPRRLLAAAFAATSVGATTFAVSLREDTPFFPWICFSFVLLGIGVGAAGVTATVTAVSSLPREEQGLAAGVLNTCQQGGGIVALSVLIAVASTYTAGQAGTGPVSMAQELAGMQLAIGCAAAAALIAVPLALFALPRRVVQHAEADSEVPLARAEDLANPLS